MKKITKARLKKVLADHAKWLADPNTGSRANLSGVDLSRVDLSGTDLSWASLSRANLSCTDLSWANLSRANLSRANLSWVNLSRANLSRANLSRANLSRANLSWVNLSGTNLSGANLDFSQWPLWCGSLNARIDERLARQLVYHALAVSEKWFKPTKKQLEWVNKFHRIPEVPKLK